MLCIQDQPSQSTSQFFLRELYLLCLRPHSWNPASDLPPVMLFLILKAGASSHNFLLTVWEDRTYFFLCREALFVSESFFFFLFLLLFTFYFLTLYSVL